MTHEEWLNSIFKSYVNKHQPAQHEQDHIKDFLEKNPEVKVSTRVSYKAIKDKSEAWTKRLNKKNKNLKESGHVELVCNFPDGSKFVRLLDQTAKNWEGKNMGHCVASYTTHQGIYSLRDEDNIPHCTIEAANGLVAQIKGKGNSKVAYRYHQQVIEGIKAARIRLTRRDIENIGYRAVTNLTAKYIKETFTGHSWFEIEGYTYFNTHSKLKLISPLKEYSLDLMKLIVECNLDCLDAFKQLLKLSTKISNVALSVPAALLKLAESGRAVYVKAIFEFGKETNNNYVPDTHTLLAAIRSGEIETLSFLMEEFKKTQVKAIKENPYVEFLNSDHMINFSQCIEQAISRERLDMLMVLLKGGAKLGSSEIYLTKLLSLAIKLNHLEIFKVVLAAKDRISPVQFTRHSMALFKDGKIKLLSALLESFSKNSEVLKLIFDKWYEEDKSNLAFLDYFVSQVGFKESYYCNAFKEALLNGPAEMVLEFTKRGANRRFNKGELLVAGLTRNKLSLSCELIKEGFLDLKPALTSECERALKLLARDFLAEGDKDFLNKFLARMTEYKMLGVVRVLNAGGIMTERQRQQLIDEAAGFQLPGDKGEYPFLKASEWEVNLDEYARIHKLHPNEWRKMPLNEKMLRWHNHRIEQIKLAESQKSEAVNKEMGTVYCFDPRTGRRTTNGRRLFQNMYGQYEDS